jgi:hypothetical protein
MEVVTAALDAIVQSLAHRFVTQVVAVVELAIRQ